MHLETYAFTKLMHLETYAFTKCTLNVYHGIPTIIVCSYFNMNYFLNRFIIF